MEIHLGETKGNIENSCDQLLVQKSRRRHLPLIVMLSLGISITYGMLDAHSGTKAPHQYVEKNGRGVTVPVTATEKKEGANASAETSSRSENSVREVTAVVRKGDSLSDFLGRYHVPAATIITLAEDAASVFALSRKMQIGDKVTLAFDEKKQLVGLTYPVDERRSLRMTTKGKGHFTARIEDNSAIRAVAAANRSEESPKPKGNVAPEIATGESEAPAPKNLSEATADPAFDLKIHSMFRSNANVVEEKVRNGDALTDLLARRSVPPNTTQAVAKAAKPVFDIARLLQPGKTLRMAFAEDGKFLGLSYPMDTDHTFWLTRTIDGLSQDDDEDEKEAFVPQIQTKAMETRVKGVSGSIRSSLFEDGRRAGLSQTMIMKLVNLFEYDVDFARDLHTGDKFSVVFEQLTHQGKPVREGEILAAQFINQGKVHYAVRFVDPSGKVGYYGKDGQNLKKMFIRAPLDFIRITSQFSSNRKHPIFGYTRAHRGVDYGAPSGTPIRAAADGRVQMQGQQGGYGNMITIRHNEKYSTAYAHLSRFVSSLHVGSSVRQGQTIGYVGMTGYATGPHLHYEVRVNGDQVNPLSVQSAAADGVPKKYLSEFRRVSLAMTAKLEGKEATAMVTAPTTASSKKGKNGKN